MRHSLDRDADNNKSKFSFRYLNRLGYLMSNDITTNHNTIRHEFNFCGSLGLRVVNMYSSEILSEVC